MSHRQMQRQQAVTQLETGSLRAQRITRPPCRVAGREECDSIALVIIDPLALNQAIRRL